MNAGERAPGEGDGGGGVGAGGDVVRDDPFALGVGGWVLGIAGVVADDGLRGPGVGD